MKNIYKYRKIDECTISNELKKYLKNLKNTDNKKIQTLWDLMQWESKTIKNQKWWTKEMDDELQAYVKKLWLKFGENYQEEEN